MCMEFLSHICLNIKQLFRSWDIQILWCKTELLQFLIYYKNKLVPFSGKKLSKEYFCTHNAIVFIVWNHEIRIILPFDESGPIYHTLISTLHIFTFLFVVFAPLCVVRQYGNVLKVLNTPLLQNIPSRMIFFVRLWSHSRRERNGHNTPN